MTDTFRLTLVRQWGSRGAGDGQFEGLAGIGVDGGVLPRVFVLDGGSSRVQRFNSSGNLETKWGSAAFYPEPGQFSAAGDLAVDSAGNVYVTDLSFGPRLVQKFDSTGRFLEAWSWDAIGVRSIPQAIAVDKDGFLYLPDPINTRFLKLTPGGGANSVSVAEGWGYPSAIAIDGDYNLYLNSGQKGVLKFSPQGRLLAEFQGVVANAMTVDGSGNLYVVGPQVVHKFTPLGVDVAGGRTIPVTDPQGIAVDRFGTLYIADNAQSRVLVYGQGQ